MYICPSLWTSVHLFHLNQWHISKGSPIQTLKSLTRCPVISSTSRALKTSGVLMTTCSLYLVFFSIFSFFLSWNWVFFAELWVGSSASFSVWSQDRIPMPSNFLGFPPNHFGWEPPHFETWIIHYPTSSGVSEWPSEQSNERSGAHKQNEQCGASEWVSSASKWAIKERVAQCLRHDSELFQTTVSRWWDFFSFFSQK